MVDDWRIFLLDFETFILWIFICSFIIAFFLISMSILTIILTCYVLILYVGEIDGHFLTVFYANSKVFLNGRLNGVDGTSFYLNMGLGYALIHNFVVFSLHVRVFIFTEKFPVDLKVQMNVAVNASVRYLFIVFLEYSHAWIFKPMFYVCFLDFVSYYRC